MMKANHIDCRRRRYFRLNAAITGLDDRRLESLFEGPGASVGWGINDVIEVDGEKVFVKRVPLTDLEVENAFSTRNLYALPTYYNYGVGSAGFGAFRELVANVKTTNWVLGGEIETFPLLYHYRIRRTSGVKDAVDADQHAKYVEYWGGNPNIGRYMIERSKARHELVLFLEYIPGVLDPWLKEHPHGIESAIEGLCPTLSFLREKGMVHFDAHFHNILIEDDRTYVTDFGLALDKCFDLTEEERAFHQAHAYYDIGEAISCLSYFLRGEEPRLGGVEGERLLKKYGEVITVMYDFYGELQKNIAHAPPVSNEKLYGLLKQCGAVA